MPSVSPGSIARFDPLWGSLALVQRSRILAGVAGVVVVFGRLIRAGIVNPESEAAILSPYWNALRSVGISYDYASGINLTILSDAESSEYLASEQLTISGSNSVIRFAKGLSKRRDIRVGIPYDPIFYTCKYVPR
jgi:hypothetical protein